MSEMKETKEAIAGTVKLVKLIAKHVRDGISPSDALILVELVNDPVYKAALMGIDDALEEVKTMSFRDGVDVLKYAIDQV